MDFTEGLPKAGGKEVIWVIVDRLSKYAHFIALNHTYIALSLAQIFMDHVYWLHGAPANILSDMDLLFLSTFWRGFLGQLGIT